MSILLDTNILTRIAEPHHAHHALAADAVDSHLRQGKKLYVVPQNIYEFWVVATRPVVSSGLGLTTAETKAKIDDLWNIVELLPDSPAIYLEWQRLVVLHDCKGKPAHDTRLVAAMIVHGIRQILTFNARDFARYPGITVTQP